MSRRHLVGVVIASCAVLLLASCSKMLDGKPVSVFEDPFRVAGMPAVDGPTGLRPDAKKSDREIENTDGGEIDELSALTISDVEDYWAQTYPSTFGGSFTPVDRLISVDSTSFADDDVCGGMPTFGFDNAMYCFRKNTIVWDRTVYLPEQRKFFGDMAIPAVLAHEYGHAIQDQAGLGDPKTTSVLVSEQQADCFHGAYMRWVAEGKSPRFTLSTADGLNEQLVSIIGSRDPVLSEQEYAVIADIGEHGSAFERISAFQFGFTDGPSACAAIDEKDVEQRRGDLPTALQESQTGEWPVSSESVQAIVDALTVVFSPANPPRLSFDADAAKSCSDARPSPPASYCPATNTIAVDLPALEAMGTTSGDTSDGRISGDNTAYSVLTSRYALALQQERGGLVLDNAEAALRTACLTGVATTAMSQQISTSGGDTIALSAGDLDEAVAGILSNGLVASDVNGETVPSGFSRMDAFRTGVLGDEDRCVKRFR
jgi:predicted metalloprotease